MLSLSRQGLRFYAFVHAHRYDCCRSLLYLQVLNLGFALIITVVTSVRSLGRGSGFCRLPALLGYFETDGTEGRCV